MKEVFQKNETISREIQEQKERLEEFENAPKPPLTSENYSQTIEEPQPVHPTKETQTPAKPKKIRPIKAERDTQTAPEQQPIRLTGETQTSEELLDFLRPKTIDAASYSLESTWSPSAKEGKGKLIQFSVLPFKYDSETQTTEEPLSSPFRTIEPFEEPTGELDSGFGFFNSSLHSHIKKESPAKKQSHEAIIPTKPSVEEAAVMTEDTIQSISTKEKEFSSLELRNKSLNESLAKLTDMHQKVLLDFKTIQENAKVLQDSESRTVEAIKSLEDYKGKLQQKVMQLQKSLGEEKGKTNGMHQKNLKIEFEYKKRLEAWEKGLETYKARFDREKLEKEKVKLEIENLNGMVKRREEKIKALETALKEMHSNVTQYKFKCENLGSIIQSQNQLQRSPTLVFKTSASLLKKVPETIKESSELEERNNKRSSIIFDDPADAAELDPEKLFEGSRPRFNGSFGTIIDPLQVRMRKTLRGGEGSSKPLLSYQPYGDWTGDWAIRN